MIFYILLCYIVCVRNYWLVHMGSGHFQFGLNNIVSFFNLQTSEVTTRLNVPRFPFFNFFQLPRNASRARSAAASTCSTRRTAYRRTTSATWPWTASTARTSPTAVSIFISRFSTNKVRWSRLLKLIITDWVESKRCDLFMTGQNTTLQPVCTGWQI